jgi:hypothetical protein
MPEFSTLSVTDARRQTAPNRLKSYMDEYIGYLHQLRPGQAGVLTSVGDETATAIRNRVQAVARELRLALIIRRKGDAVYFWREQQDASRPRSGSAGGLLSPEPSSGNP